MANYTEPSNLPGLEYLLRIGQAWTGSMTGQVSTLQTAWNEVRKGDFTTGKVVQLWAKLAESQFDVVTEVAKGPAYVFRPAWVYFTHQLGTTDKPLESVAKIDRTESQATSLDTTDLASMKGGEAISGSGKDSVYQTCKLTESRKAVSITLDLAVINGKVKAAGQYMGFILGKDRGAEPPLVIVILRVEA